MLSTVTELVKLLKFRNWLAYKLLRMMQRTVRQEVVPSDIRIIKNHDLASIFQG